MDFSFGRGDDELENDPASQAAMAYDRQYQAAKQARQLAFRFPSIEVFDLSFGVVGAEKRLLHSVPWTLPLLRRIQFYKFFETEMKRQPIPGLGLSLMSNTAVHSSVVYVCGPRLSIGKDGHFAAAFFDYSQGPGTKCWVYSSLEKAILDYIHPGDEENTHNLPFDVLLSVLPEKEVEDAVDMLIKMFRRMRAL